MAAVNGQRHVPERDRQQQAAAARRRRRRRARAAALRATNVIGVSAESIGPAAGPHHGVLGAHEFRFQCLWAESQRQGLQFSGRGQALVQAGLGGVVGRRGQKLCSSRHPAAPYAMRRPQSNLGAEIMPLDRQGQSTAHASGAAAAAVVAAWRPQEDGHRPQRP